MKFFQSLSQVVAVILIDKTLLYCWRSTLISGPNSKLFQTRHSEAFIRTCECGLLQFNRKRLFYSFNCLVRLEVTGLQITCNKDKVLSACLRNSTT